jgi:RNA polymerase sigma-70 factor (ECF subfamily)
MYTAAIASQTFSDGVGRPSRDVRTGLVALVPQLRAFARMLCGDRQEADGLAQASLAAAWRFRRRLQPGTNLKTWLFTIARNQFHGARRDTVRQGGFSRDAMEPIVDQAVAPLWPAELSQTLSALGRLPDPLREALLLVDPGGFSYEEAASICGCQPATAKRRVEHARRMLLAILDGTPAREDHSRRAG